MLFQLRNISLMNLCSFDVKLKKLGNSYSAMSISSFAFLPHSLYSHVAHVDVFLHRVSSHWTLLWPCQCRSTPKRSSKAPTVTTPVKSSFRSPWPSQRRASASCGCLLAATPSGCFRRCLVCEKTSFL